MKIGILTQPLLRNYGGILQNYALQTVLRKKGHKVWTFDLLKYTWKDWTISAIKTIIKKMIGRKADFPLTPHQKKKIEKPLRTFVYNKINLTTRVKKVSWQLVKKYNLDTLVVGSDQVWRPIYNHSIEDMFFRFADDKNIKKIAYSASFGTDKWEFSPKQTNECATLAKKFDAISVRESFGVELCKNYLGVEATHTLDPTLLLTDKDYNTLCKHIPKSEPFVFAYILDMDERKVAEIKSFAQAKGLPYFIKSADNDVKDTDSIELWLSYFRDAAFVVTDSFHGTAFSINYNKDFFVFENRNRGNSRFESLLSLFDLNHRMVEKINANIKSINWIEVNECLNNERVRCYEFIEKALNQ